MHGLILYPLIYFLCLKSLRKRNKKKEIKGAFGSCPPRVVARQAALVTLCVAQTLLPQLAKGLASTAATQFISGATAPRMCGERFVRHTCSIATTTAMWFFGRSQTVPNKHIDDPHNFNIMPKSRISSPSWHDPARHVGLTGSCVSIPWARWPTCGTTRKGFDRAVPACCTMVR